MNDYEDAMEYIRHQLIADIEKNVGIPANIFEGNYTKVGTDFHQRVEEVIRCHASSNAYKREDASVVPEWAARKGAIEVEAEVIKIQPAELLDKQQET